MEVSCVGFFYTVLSRQKKKLAKEEVCQLHAHQNVFWDFPSLQTPEVWESPGEGAKCMNKKKRHINWVPTRAVLIWVISSHPYSNTGERVIVFPSDGSGKQGF